MIIKKSETIVMMCRSKKTMIRMASVVIQSPLFISSQKKSENMKGITRLLLTTPSSVVPSYSNSRILFTVVKTRLMSIKTDRRDAKLSKAHSNMQDNSGIKLPAPRSDQDQSDNGKASGDGVTANSKDSENSDRPTIKECNHTLDEMQLLDMSDPLYAVACSIFCESKAHREQWMLLRQKPKQVIKNWIEMNGKKLRML
ncbi:hypothetical protein RHMOL_Rhmol05G0294700 [Rhododendron molle]|uniref:Uncharacterized protein n=1 Tax=Rhododendron molle TaxID=49168 RepID=A0ACC0NU90_RHOML|nr:hypothetical protein RHMOL_Rhmol05G0294700 [Rhododendron molle]